MKKIIFIALSFPIFAFSQSALQTKTFAKDSLTDLKPRINVWQITIDARSEKVAYVYDIEYTVPKNGIVVSKSESKAYVRCNAPAKTDLNGTVIEPAKTDFTKFMNKSAIDSIKAVILKDINKMKKIDDTNLLEQ